MEVQTTESDILPTLTLEKGPRVRGAGELGGRTNTPRHHFFEQPKVWGFLERQIDFSSAPAAHQLCDLGFLIWKTEITVVPSYVLVLLRSSRP